MGTKFILLEYLSNLQSALLLPVLSSNIIYEFTAIQFKFWKCGSLYYNLVVKFLFLVVTNFIMKPQEIDNGIFKLSRT